MAKRIVCCVLSMLMLLSFLPLHGQALKSDELKEQIEQMEQQQEALEAAHEVLEQQKQDNVDDMKAVVANKNIVDQQILLLQIQQLNLEEQIRVLSLLIADQQEQLDQAQAACDSLELAYKARIRAMEEEGTVSYWAILFKANSFLDFLDRLSMIREIAAADARRLQQLKQARQQVSQAKDLLLEQKDALKESRLALEENRAQLNAKRAEADGLLQKLIAKGEEFEALLDQSELMQDQLMEELAQAEQDLKEQLAKEEAAKKPTVSKEGWLTPVVGYVLTSPFGMRMHPILGYERMHNGVDMACPAMTPIYASRSGVVSVASFQADGAGHYVQLNHGDGYRSIYMHMTYYTVSEGQYVTQGQIIGYVGNSGLSKGNHLHFGISYNGIYVNPMKYL